MAEFYTWAWQARLVVTFLLWLCVLSQATAMMMSFFSRKRLKALPELCALAVVLYLSLLYGQVIEGYELGLVLSAGYGAVRIGAGNRWFALVFIAVILFCLARSVYVSLRRYREIGTNISSLSVKNAIDSLRTGVLFSEPDGFILLSNAKMQWLMTTLTGKIQRNGWDFYFMLSSDNLRPGCRKAEFEGQIVCLLPDGAAWMFTKTELHINQKMYIQLTAADITERWELTARLREQNSQLERRGEELKRTIANLHTLSQEREATKAKMRAHDILGQRMTLLLRTVRDRQSPDYGLLQSLSRELMDELKAAGEISALESFDSLRQEFGFIGVELRLEGSLPEDCAKGELFADIVRESATNAVRHGFATQVVIQMEHTKSRCRMTITNNGPPPPESFSEGGGLSGIRRKVEAQGGTLQVETQPRFTLKIDLPEGDANA